MTTSNAPFAAGCSLQAALPAARPLSPTASRALIASAILAALIAGFLVTDAQDAARAVHQAGPELTRLLRGMAAIKVLMAAIASGAVLWRLGCGASWPWLAAYMAAAATMAVGPGLIWSMAHVGAGALALHGGLLAMVVLLWRDPATGRLLAARVRKQAILP